MPIRVELKADQISVALDRLSAALDDMTPLFQEIGDLLRASTKDRFTAGEAPDGSKWAAKSPATLAAYAARNAPIDIRPLFGPSRRLADEISVRSWATGAEIGSSLVYAAVQQFGAAKGSMGARMGRTRPSEKRPKSQDYFITIPWGDIPARPFLGISTQDQTYVLKAIDEWLAGAAGGAGSAPPGPGCS